MKNILANSSEKPCGCTKILDSPKAADQTCPATGYQRVSVCAPVEVRPFARPGVTRTKCCGKPKLTPGKITCHGDKNGSCHFTVNQELCIKVPVMFGASATVGDTHVKCLGVSSEDTCDECGGGGTKPPLPKRVSLPYLFGATSEQYLEMLAKTRHSITMVCPDFFNLDDGGNLVLAGVNKLNKPFIDALHAQGILVVPFITNHFDRPLAITAIENREALSGQIADAIEEYGLDGVDVDIENATHEQRDIYTDLMRLLRQRLGESKIVATAVAANPRGFTVGWHGQYDYKALSYYCDYLMIMNYDEHFQGGPEGPISSSDFFVGSIEYALAQEVPKERIISGIPFFGRYWKEGEHVGGIGLAGRDVEFLLDNYASSHRFDNETQSDHAIVTIKTDDVEPEIWGGRKMTAGTYSIWYDSPRATRFKLETINRYDLLGVGSWCLGQEILSVWDFFNDALNNLPA